MVNEHWDKVDSEYALAEGGTTVHARREGALRCDRHHRESAARAATDRPRDVGPCSVPRPDNPIVAPGSRGRRKAGQYQVPMRLNETTRMFFKRLAEISTPEEAVSLHPPGRPTVGARWCRRRCAWKYVSRNSMLRTSISPDHFQGGIPKQRDSRLTPRPRWMYARSRRRHGQGRGRSQAPDRRPAVEIVRNPSGGRRRSHPQLTRRCSAHWRRTQASMFPGAATLPVDADRRDRHVVPASEGGPVVRHGGTRAWRPKAERTATTSGSRSTGSASSWNSFTGAPLRWLQPNDSDTRNLKVSDRRQDPPSTPHLTLGGHHFRQWSGVRFTLRGDRPPGPRAKYSCIRIAAVCAVRSGMPQSPIYIFRRPLARGTRAVPGPHAAVF